MANVRSPSTRRPRGSHLADTPQEGRTEDKVLSSDAGSMSDEDRWVIIGAVGQFLWAIVEALLDN